MITSACLTARVVQEEDEFLEGIIPPRSAHVITGDESAFINAFGQSPNEVSFPGGPADVNGEGCRC